VYHINKIIIDGETMMFVTDPRLALDNTIERRCKPRLDCNYPAQVRFHGPGGDRIEKEATISNLSATGLYLHLDQCLEPGDGLFIMARVLEEPANMYRAFSIASQGIVVRSESQGDGRFGVAVKINQRRILQLDTFDSSRQLSINLI
jgi:hypothetical protein